jgi:hypothetical protein
MYCLLKKVITPGSKILKLFKIHKLSITGREWDVCPTFVRILRPGDLSLFSFCTTREPHWDELILLQSSMKSTNFTLVLVELNQ